MSINGTIKDGKLTLTVDLASAPYVSNSEKAKAEKEKRDPVAHMLASSNGFTRLGDVRISLNVLKG